MKQISDLTNDCLWGVESISRYIGRDRRQTYYLIKKRVIPAKKLGARTIMARKTELDVALSKLGATNGE
jgi:hypothetical protein